MSFVRIAVERPVATLLLTVAIILAGMFGYRQLPLAALPQVDFPIIQISANLPGANPSTMASAVATPIERQLTTIAGIQQITSSSSSGMTQITVQFDLDRDIDAAALDVQTALSAVARRLPVEMPAPPSFEKTNPADQSVLILSLFDPTKSLTDMQAIADTSIIPRISTLPGVSRVEVYGARKYAVRIQFDPHALATRGLTPEDLRLAVANANSNAAVGIIAEGSRNYILDASGSMQNASDFAQIIIGYHDGVAIRVSDVALSVDSTENLRGGTKFNGQASLTFGIKRQPGSNVVALVDRVEALLPELREGLPPNASLGVLVDRSQSVRHSVADAQWTLLGTALLVILVIYLALGDVRATMVPAVVLPVAAVGTFAGMYLADFSLDTLSLLALTLATGFVVDDAIVVLENIVRHVSKGEKPRRAAVSGTNEIAFTVVSISVSLIAVFIPLLFMGGVVGRLFREFAVVLTMAIVISGIVSLTLTPMMAARVLASRPVAPGRVARWSTRSFERAGRAYARTLDNVLHHRRAVMIFIAASLALTIWGFATIPKGFFPNEDTGVFFVATEVAPDSSYSTLLEKQDKVAAILLADPSMLRVNSIVFGGNGGRMFAQMKPRAERDAGDVVQARLRKKLNSVPGISAFASQPQNLSLGGRSSASQYQYSLVSVDQAALYALAPKFEARLRENHAFEDVASDFQRGARQARVEIDRDAAGRLGVSVRAIRDTLYSSFGSRQISTIYTDVDSYQVIMEIDPAMQLTPDSIDALYVRGNGNAVVSMAAVTRLIIEGVPTSVNHQGQLPAVTISFNLAKGVALSEAKTVIEATLEELSAPANVSGSFQGSAQAFEASNKGMGWLFLAAILVIYIVLGVLYESLVHPLTILSGLPAAGMGALFALWLFDMPLDVIGIIGVVMLIGIVKKNAIIMIDFALSAMRERGLEAEAAIREACDKRFRPIMMTTFAAIAAALPLALGLGAGAELRQPLGVAVLGGLLFSQFLTLYITPVVFLGLEGLRGRSLFRRR